MSRGRQEPRVVIRRCGDDDLAEMIAVINDAATAYRGVIPDESWHEPYMPVDELRAEIRDRVVFWGRVNDGRLDGVMGIQDRGDAALIRHAYVRSVCRGRGIGSALLEHLEDLTTKPLLVGTWKAATWAVAFYEKHGFHVLDAATTRALLDRYWSIPSEQATASVVLASARWLAEREISGVDT